MKWIEDEDGALWNLSNINSIDISYDSICVYIEGRDFFLIGFRMKKITFNGPLTQDAEIEKYNSNLEGIIKIIRKEIVEFIKDETLTFLSIPEILKQLEKPE